MKRVWGLTLLCFLLVRLGFGYDPVRPEPAVWADSVFNAFTLDERVGQLIELQVFVTHNNVDDYLEIIDKYPIGHLMIIGGQPVACARLIRHAQARARIPMLVTFKNYMGVGIPLDSVHQFAGFPTIGRINNPDILRAVAGELAIQSRALQVGAYNSSIAHIAVGRSGIHTIVSDGCGDDERCETNLVQLLHSLLDEGVMLSFDLDVDFKDSHQALERYWDVDFWTSMSQSYDNTISTFIKRQRNAIALRIRQLPFVEDGEEHSFRRRFITPLISRSLNHQGLIVLDIHALKKMPTWDDGGVYGVKGLELGAHMISISEDIDSTFQEVRQYFSSGGMRQAMLQEKVTEILKHKRNVYIEKEYLPDPSNLYRILNRPEAKLVSNRIHKDAVTVERAKGQILPIPKLEGKYFASVAIGTGPESLFRSTLDLYAPFVHFEIPSISYDPFRLERLRDRLRGFDYIIIAVHTFEYAHVDQRLIEFVNDLQEDHTLMVAFLGIPANAQDFSSTFTRIYASEDNHITQLLVPQLVFGGYSKALGEAEMPIEYTGFSAQTPVYRISTGLPEEQQMDSWTLDKIDDIVEQSIKMEAIPGCQVVVARNGSIVFNRNYGYYTYDSLMHVEQESVYDLASITKVAATTQALMYLYERKLLDPDKTLGFYLPELEGTNKADLVIRDILTHQSGLRSFLPFWQYTLEKEADSIFFYSDHPSDVNSLEVALGMYGAQWLKDSLWQWTVDSRLRRKYRHAQYNYRYSDLGFYILQVLAERLLEQPLDHFVDSVFYRPMGMRTMTYKPLCKYPQLEVVPTELDETFRKILLWGTVHDPIAAMYGGVAGHAGLFSNAVDLVKLVQMNMQGGTYAGDRYLSPAVISEFTRQQFDDNRRGLGWDKPERDKVSSATSRYASAATFGHSGFTGTIVWADPTFNLIFVFLSNRVHPHGNNRKLNRYNVRKRIHDLVYESMWNYEKFNN